MSLVAVALVAFSFIGCSDAASPRPPSPPYPAPLAYTNLAAALQVGNGTRSVRLPILATSPIERDLITCPAASKRMAFILPHSQFSVDDGNLALP